MNKAVKDALAKGKQLRDELDKKAQEEALKLQKAQKDKEAKAKADIQNQADRCLAYVPEGLAKAVAERKSSFPIMTYNADKDITFSAIAPLIRSGLEKMGLQSKITTSTGWVQMTYDPDTGYDATYLHLEVIVPDEGL